jgi:hypothetical protein
MRLAFVALLLPLACEEHDCTLIGCSSALLLRVETAGEPIGDTFTGEVVVGESTYAIDCPAQSGCGDGEVSILLDEADAGGEVTYELRAGSGEDDALTGAGTIAVSWSESQPNGPECGPTCSSGLGIAELFEVPAE